MCGIYGILSNGLDNNNLIQFILDGLIQLQNRGYDSAGIYCLNKEYESIYEKYASTDKEDALDKLNQMNLENKAYTIGIGHNRWATHGGKTDINAHPHQSNNTDFIIVHNGIIENFQKLKDILLSKGYIFYSQTDTEIIANLLEENYKETENVTESIKKTINMLQGTYGLVIIHKKEPNRLYCVRNGSPLLIGHNDEYCIITSEQSGFCKKVNRYITLNNDDICEISIDKHNHIKINYAHTYFFKKVIMDHNDLTPEPYKHWTLKEIHEQPQKILNSINLGGRILTNNLVKLGGLDDNKHKLKDIEHIILLGCGTSYYSCMYGKDFFKKLCNFNTIHLYDGADFEANDIPIKGQTLIVFVSQSGETKDLHRCINIAKNKNILTMGIINVVDSLIAREVDFGIYCNAGREMGVASTKAFTTQVICLCLCALWFSQSRNINEHIRTHIIKDLQNLSCDFEKCLTMVNNNINNIVQLLSNYNNLFILGKNNDEAIALEGSLKIKEISYIHSEGYSSSALKHGPFALLGPDMPLILLNNNIEYEPKVLNCYEEVASRKSPIIFITNNKTLEKENTINIPYNESFSSLLGIIPLQLIAYELSILRGNNPDKPKNLAKVVTVE
jgi:glucosamine--fructose-6-phosphate aminotransferase (isomerizing)